MFDSQPEGLGQNKLVFTEGVVKEERAAAADQAVANKKQGNGHCCSFSRTRPAESVRTTSMMTMPMVPGRKKSESRRSGLYRTICSILISYNFV